MWLVSIKMYYYDDDQVVIILVKGDYPHVCPLLFTQIAAIFERKTTLRARAAS